MFNNRPVQEVIEANCHLRPFKIFVWQNIYYLIRQQKDVHIGHINGCIFGGVRRMNEVNARRARLVLGWVTVFGRVYHLGV